MKKLLIYFNSMQPSGGIERVIATLSNKLAENYLITVLVKDTPDSFYTLNEKVVIKSLDNELKFNMNSRLSRFFTAISNIISNTQKLRIFLKSNSFDYYYLAHPLNVLEFNLAGADHQKIIISEHGARSAYNTVYKIIKKMLYTRCNKYIVPTTTDTKLYQQDNFPATYIPHFRSNLPYSLSDKTKNVVLNIGRFTSDKQQLVLLNIWNNILNVYNIRNWQLLIVGQGELENVLLNYVKDNRMEDYVEFLPPSKEVENYYNNASIFALTSSSEGFGMVLLEAISFGLPCVTFDCPSGPRDIINEGNGYLVELNNNHLFEKMLVGLLMDRNKIIQMGLKAYNSSSEWSDERTIEKWYKILK